MLIAIMVVTLMLGVGLAILSIVDTQSQQSGRERGRESAFNLTEGALQEQGYILGTATGWPGNPGKQYPANSGPVPYSCSSSTAPTAQCPNPSNLANASGTGNFNEADFRSGTNWQTLVLDNGNIDPTTGQPSEFYDPSLLTRPCTGSTAPGPCTWDANGDGKIWVRASSSVNVGGGTRTRVIVALLKREKLTEPFPNVAIVAGSISACCGPQKTFIDAQGSQVVVRCSSTSSSCVGPGPPNVTGQVINNPSAPPAMTPAEIARAKATAQTSNPPTYCAAPGTPGFDTSFCQSNGCPRSLAPVLGSIVFVEQPTATCTYNGNDIYNSSSQPGVVIVNNGTLSIGPGTAQFYGIIYMMNSQNSTGVVFSTSGNATVHGSVAVDGPGQLSIGNSNNAGVSYDPNGPGGFQTFGTAGLIQNTWRELSPGQG